ncbi:MULTISPECIES: glycoside hydrolase family 16 protein [unclassified Bradyrhizobium]|uniref:glycoside hydrolase family 16 protein n=1 Tax=unclassified Bradyrhizobium TaxID=2631580 RepID=UPI003394AE03
MNQRLVKFLSAATLILAILPVAPARAGGWELVFSDEFNGNQLDRNKWATRFIYNNETLDHFNDEIQRYRDSQITLSDGVLALTAEKKPGSSLFESGLIRSHRTFYYGYYEARVFLPYGKGVWPAFWLEADYDQDGRTWHPPEIDIFEYVINGVEDKPNMLHSNVAGRGDYVFTDPSFQTKFAEMMGKENLNEGWHVVGMAWQPDRVTLFWDGRRIYTKMYQWLRRDGQLGPPAHIDFNFAIGGGWAGRHGIDESAFPQKFRVDYIRVCQFTSSGKGKRQCGPSEMTPDPQEFGYADAPNDMPKPQFLRMDHVGNARANSGAVALPMTGNRLDLTVPIKFPEQYPSARTLRVSFIDEATGATVTSATQRLDLASITKRPDGAAEVDVSLPALQRPGRFRVDATLIAESVDAKGAKQTLPAPATCSTDLPQPVKARSCQLLHVDVQR